MPRSCRVGIVGAAAQFEAVGAFSAIRTLHAEQGVGGACFIARSVLGSPHRLLLFLCDGFVEKKGVRCSANGFPILPLICKVRRGAFSPSPGKNTSRYLPSLCQPASRCKSGSS